MQRLIVIIFSMLADLFKAYRVYEKTQAVTQKIKLEAMSAPGVHQVADLGGDAGRGTMMNLFGAISGYLLLLKKLKAESVFDSKQETEVKKQLNKLKKACPNEPQVQKALEDTISVYA